MNQRIRKVVVVIAVVGLSLAGCSKGAETNGQPITGEQMSDGIAKAPSKAEQLVDRGMAALEQGDVAKALADVDEALRLEPESARALGARARVYLKQGEAEKALRDADRALALDGKSAEAWLTGGEALQARNGWSPSVPYLSNALVLDPENATAYGARGKAYLEIGEWEKSIADYTEALKRAPAVELYVQRGTAYFYAGNMLAAKWDLDMAVRQKPRTAADMTLRGRLHLSLGDPEKAAADFTAALEMDEKHYPARLGRAYAYFDLGEKAKAREDALLLGGAEIPQDLRGEANRIILRIDQGLVPPK
ncbi:MAG: peptidase caspase catalytic subunit p20 [Symbiobacteriaceae bacterium]|jgi:Tfp pilus assembly protein PilF|nr:peptidase caspase catalytic subunit p20 [Symbiobacteriaceae bacterium]